MQSIFRPASRRKTLGEQSEGDRRDGGLKMGWTKPLPRAWPMGIDCLPDLGRGSDVARSDERVGCFVGSGCVQWPMTVLGEWDLAWDFLRDDLFGNAAPVAWPGQACAAQLDL